MQFGAHLRQLSLRLCRSAHFHLIVPIRVAWLLGAQALIAIARISHYSLIIYLA